MLSPVGRLLLSFFYVVNKSKSITIASSHEVTARVCTFKRFSSLLLFSFFVSLSLSGYTCSLYIHITESVVDQFYHSPLKLIRVKPGKHRESIFIAFRNTNLRGCVFWFSSAPALSALYICFTVTCIHREINDADECTLQMTHECVNTRFVFLFKLYHTSVWVYYASIYRFTHTVINHISDATLYNLSLSLFLSSTHSFSLHCAHRHNH